MLIRRAIDFAKTEEKYPRESFPKTISEAFILRVIGKSKVEFCNKLCDQNLLSQDWYDLLYNDTATKHRLNIDHLKAQNLQLLLKVSDTLDEYLRVFAHSNSQLRFAGTNLLKGCMSVVESCKFFDQEDNFLEWRFRPLNDPDNLLARVKNKEMSLYADLATNLPAILMNLIGC